MIERIDLFLPPRSQYQVLHHFTKDLAEGLSRSGVRCRILKAQKNHPKPFIDKIMEDPPECTLSFNGLLPDSEGRFFCDLLQIPHVACLVDGPQHFVTLTQSPLSIITCMDQYHCDFFQGLKFDRVFFMPHGVNRNLFTSPKEDSQRPYDFLVLSSFMDHEEIWNQWRQKYPLAFCNALLEAATTVIMERDASLVQSLVHSLDRYAKTVGSMDLNNIDFLMLIDQLEEYLIGKARVELLKGLKNVRVTLIGSNSERWKKYLSDQVEADIRPQVSYEQALHLMRQSKIVLNCCPAIKQGTHERTLAGIASGALVITDDNPFIYTHFKNGKNILVYQHGHWDAFNDMVQEYLKDENRRLAIVEEGQKVVREQHTWDHRAATLLNDIGRVIENLS